MVSNLAVASPPPPPCPYSAKWPDFTYDMRFPDDGDESGPTSPNRNNRGRAGWGPQISKSSYDEINKPESRTNDPDAPDLCVASSTVFNRRVPSMTDFEDHRAVNQPDSTCNSSCSYAFNVAMQLSW